MKYLMTYVRQLPFAEEPDYEFLDHCLNFGKYNYQTWHGQMRALRGLPDSPAGAPAADSAGAGAPAASGGALVAGSKRKRIAGGDEATDDVPDAKRIRCQLPEEPPRAFMWFVISVNPLEGREAFSSHTTYRVSARGCCTYPSAAP
jgi:hypothetical protein